MIARARAGGIAFSRFWYDFVVGDDWTVAATVTAGLLVTWALARRGVSAWWLMPAVCLALLLTGVARTGRAPR